MKVEKWNENEDTKLLTTYNYMKVEKWNENEDTKLLTDHV